MSPALSIKNGTNGISSDNKPGAAVAVYCGAHAGTEPVFHHAAACPFVVPFSHRSTTAQLLTLADSESYLPFIFIFNSPGACPRNAITPPCVWRWHQGDNGYHL